MFCDRCGTQISGAGKFCPSCGKPVAPVSMMSRPSTGRIAGHVRTLGILWLAYAALRVLSGWFFVEFFQHFATMWIPHMPFFLPGILRGAGMFLILGGVLCVLTGWGLLERQPWARTLGIVMGFLVLFHFGLGTALGIYTLWVLLPAESAQEYQQIARTA